MDSGQVTLGNGASANVAGTNNTFTVDAGATLGTAGGGNTITTYGSNDVVSVNDTANNFDLITTNAGIGGGTAASGETSGIYVGANAQANLVGSGDAVVVAGGATLGAYGGANTITTSGTDNFIVLGQTNGAFDTVYSNDETGGTSFHGDGTGIYLDAGNQANVIGTDDTVTVLGGDSLGVYGANNSIDVNAPNDFVVIGNTNGGFDNVTGSNDVAGGVTANGQGTGIDLDTDSQANVNGNNDALTVLGGDSLGVYGQGNSVAIDAPNDFVVIGQTNGDADTITGSNDPGGGSTWNGQPTGIALNDDSQANVTGSNDTIYDQAVGDTVNVSGGNDTVGLGAGDYVGLLGGTGYTVDGSGGTIATWDNTGFALNGSSDVAYLGVNNSVALDSGTKDTLAGNDESIVTDAGTSLDVYGDSNTVDAGVNGTAYVGLTGGTGEVVVGSNDEIGTVNDVVGTISGANDTIALGGGADVAVSGAGDIVKLGADTALTLSNTGGAADTVYANGDGSGTADDGAAAGITLGGAADANVSGNNDMIVLNSGDTLGAFGGGNTIANLGANDQLTLGGTANDIDTVSGSGDMVGGHTNDGSGNVGVFLNNNTQVAINGSNDAVTLANDDELNASGVVEFANYSNGNIIHGSNDTLNGDHNDYTEVGSNDVTDGSRNLYYYLGSNDITNNQNTQYVDSNSADATNQYGYNADTSLETNYNPIIDDPEYTDSFYYDLGDNFDYGFVGAGPPVSTGGDAIAAAAAARGDTAAAAAATAAFQQAQQSAAGALATSAATLGAEPAEPRWTAPTITWSFAEAPANGLSEFSGALGPDAQSVVAGAMQTWASASGLDLQQVAAGSASDIDIGWSDLATATTDMIGFTTARQSGGILLPGVDVLLEDPNETALTAGADGQPGYAGSGATLFQVALHEIGHALGLGDDSDPHSVMYYSLGANNTTLDATDLAAIPRLYSDAPTAGYASSDASATPASLAALTANAASLVTPLAGSLQLPHA